MPAMTLGKLLRITRVMKEIAQKDLAARVGISAQYLSNIELGRVTFPSEIVLKKLAEELELDYDQLIWLSAKSQHNMSRGAEEELSEKDAEFRNLGIPEILDRLLEIPFIGEIIQAVKIYFPELPFREQGVGMQPHIVYYLGPEGWEFSFINPDSQMGHRIRKVATILRSKKEDEKDGRKAGR